jgi:hypothetical protein
MRPWPRLDGQFAAPYAAPCSENGRSSVPPELLRAADATASAAAGTLKPASPSRDWLVVGPFPQVKVVMDVSDKHCTFCGGQLR